MLHFLKVKSSTFVYAPGHIHTNTYTMVSGMKGVYIYLLIFTVSTKTDDVGTASSSKRQTRGT